ncbi:hypothetical protein F5I97DRAFT_1931907 [Phlebopus sp. FC_14]|nr:hypothetical protein F5I97DRAFT_1931907 [Phlebopus sp. FC_14]
MPQPQPQPAGYLSRHSFSEHRRSSLAETRARSASELGGYRPSTPYSTAVETHHHLKQKEPWLEAARESTDHLKKHGSPLPLVWVLAADNNIPPNAVPFGEDRNGCPLYIARALLEGGLHLGKAAPHLPGAVITYAGKEHIMHRYEVLVFASQLRWGFPPQEPNGVLAQGTVILAQQHKYDPLAHRTLTGTPLHSASLAESLNTTLHSHDISRYIPDGFVFEQPDREAGLRRLAEIKAVVLIDDSISVICGNRREEPSQASSISRTSMGSKGVDLHFMHQDDYGPNMQTRYAVEALFDQVHPEGMSIGEDTPTGAKLNQIIDAYLPLIEQKGTTHEPIAIIVVTDGVATDQEELERCIVETAHRLERAGVREDMFGIQFVQIGTDEAAAELLRVLDDQLVDHYKIRDIVDSTPFNPAQGIFDTEYMLKILLGGIRKDLDNARPKLLSPLNGGGSPRHSPRGLIPTARLPTSPHVGGLKTLPRY